MTTNHPEPIDGAIYHGDGFHDPADLVGKLEESLFRYASLSDFAIDGGHIASVLSRRASLG